MIDTTLGPMDPADLCYIETRQQMPCGVALTKTYTYDGQVVKRDVHIELHTEAKQEGQQP